MTLRRLFVLVRGLPLDSLTKNELRQAVQDAKEERLAARQNRYTRPG